METSQPGALLGSGIKKVYIYTTILNEIIGLDSYYNQDISDQLVNGLGALSGALETLYETYGFIGLFSLAQRKDELPANVSRDDRQAAKKVFNSFQELSELLNSLEKSLIPFIINSDLSSIPINDYFQNLSEVEALQADVQTRSAKGVAGYVSEVRRAEVSSLPVADRHGGGFTIAAGVTIENAVGGKGNDDITGNVADNLIRGLGGDDLINPYLGSNKIKGGQGVDTVNFDSELDSWQSSDLSFEQGDRWLKVTMGDSGDINRLRGVEFLVFGGEQYAVDSLI